MLCCVALQVLSRVCAACVVQACLTALKLQVASDPDALGQASCFAFGVAILHALEPPYSTCGDFPFYSL